MPEIGQIQSTNFQALLTSLGITRNNIPFALRSEVTPVVLVGGTVSFIAAPTPAYRVQDIFTAGFLVAPAAGTVLADTGPLPAGAYSFTVWYGAGEVNSFDFQWRDAANAASLWTHIVTNTLVSGQTWGFQLFRLNIQNNDERFRILTVAAAAVGIGYQATILGAI